MNILLWALQGLLALHTLIGALWKVSNPAQTLPSLQAIPPGIWLAISVFELLCVVGLLLPAVKPSQRRLASWASLGIAAEMVMFSGVQLNSGVQDSGQLIYWGGVALLSLLIAVARWKEPKPR